MAESRTPGAANDVTAGSGSNGDTVQVGVRVLIADDRSRSRRGLRALLATQPGIEVIGEAGNGREALRLVEEHRPDAVLMDAKMPVMDGLTATRLLKERWPEIKVIVLTMFGCHQADALTAGADTFLVKGCQAGKLLEAITSTMLGTSLECCEGVGADAARGDQPPRETG